MSALPNNFPFQPPMLTAPPKQCKVCMRWFDPKDFAVKTGAARRLESYCLECEATGDWKRHQDNAKAEQIEQKSTELAVKSFVAQLRGTKIDAPHISEVCAEMLKRFGGLESFTVSYYQIGRASCRERV